MRLQAHQPLHRRLDDTFSSIGKLRGKERREWGGMPTPLVIMFQNYALEGASLSDVNIGYDPNKGNMLGFSIKSRYDNAARAGNPQDELMLGVQSFRKRALQEPRLKNIAMEKVGEWLLFSTAKLLALPHYLAL